MKILFNIFCIKIMVTILVLAGFGMYVLMSGGVTFEINPVIEIPEITLEMPELVIVNPEFTFENPDITLEIPSLFGGGT